MSQATVTGARVPRRAAYAGAGALGILGLSTAGVAAVALNALTRARPAPAATSARVIAVEPSSVPGCTVAVTILGEDADEPGWNGLVTDGGRLLAGPPTRTTAGWRRHCAPVPGAADPGLEVGAHVTVSAHAWAGCDDPFLLGSSTVQLDSEVGTLVTTSVGQPDSRRAVVYVHGRGGSRATGMWLAPTCASAGWRTVMPAYRNDPDGPSTGRYLLGGEWVDLVAVLDHLTDDGVEEVVLIGWSMGGNICASYLRQRERSPERFAHHPVPVGLVLDAAALDWGEVLQHVATHRRLPRQLVPLVMAYGQFARRIDWRDLNHLADPEHLGLPMLAFHGGDDDVVPVEASRMLAASLPHVQLESFPDAGHCRSLNVDPGRYLTALRRFLDGIGATRHAERRARDGAR